MIPVMLPAKKKMSPKKRSIEERAEQGAEESPAKKKMSPGSGSFEQKKTEDEEETPVTS